MKWICGFMDKVDKTILFFEKRNIILNLQTKKVVLTMKSNTTFLRDF